MNHEDIRITLAHRLDCNCPLCVRTYGHCDGRSLLEPVQAPNDSEGPNPEGSPMHEDAPGP